MPQKLRIIADSNIWGAKKAFQALAGLAIQLEVLEAADIDAASIKTADILLIRSSTPINEDLLHGSKVRFVGTATIGDDHVDQTYLRQQGICFASAAGSSTASVVEYMCASLYWLEQQQSINLQQATLGIIGVGRIGGLLNQACTNIGLTTLLNDPPRQEVEPRAGFKSLAYLLQYADILTLHTPLTEQGKHNTKQLLNQAHIQQFKGNVIINAGRGACLDNQALWQWLQADQRHLAILDCWENEPYINRDLLNHPQLCLATPHIAGHSLDGKAANTQYIYDALCIYLKIANTWQHELILPPILALPTPNTSPARLVQQLYPIEHDHQAMKHAGLKEDDFAAWFKHYRRHYPIRRAWHKVLQQMNITDHQLLF